MSSERKCPNTECPNFGKQCWKHCSYCGESILWKPKGMDFNVKYSGPKPLDPTTGKKHICPEGKEQATTNQGKFLQHGYPSLQKHYSRCYHHGIGIQQECGDPNCICAKVKAMKDPEALALWNHGRAQWLKNWDQPVNPKFYVLCERCNRPYKLTPKHDSHLCESCYWQDVWERGGLPPLPRPGSSLID